MHHCLLSTPGCFKFLLLPFHPPVLLESRAHEQPLSSSSFTDQLTETNNRLLVLTANADLSADISPRFRAPLRTRITGRSAPLVHTFVHRAPDTRWRHSHALRWCDSGFFFLQSDWSWVFTLEVIWRYESWLMFIMTFPAGFTLCHQTFSPLSEQGSK